MSEPIPEYLSDYTLYESTNIPKIYGKHIYNQKLTYQSESKHANWVIPQVTTGPIIKVYIKTTKSDPLYNFYNLDKNIQIHVYCSPRTVLGQVFQDIKYELGLPDYKVHEVTFISKNTLFSSNKIKLNPKYTMKHNKLSSKAQVFIFK